MEVKSGWLSSFIAITKRSLSAKCDHDSVVFLGTLVVDEEQQSLGYCSKCSRVVYSKDDSTMKKMLNYVTYDPFHNKFKFALQNINDQDRVYTVEYEVIKFMLEKGEISLPLSILYNTIQAAKTALIQKGKQIDSLVETNNKLENDVIVLTQLAVVPPENDFSVEEEVPSVPEKKIMLWDYLADMANELTTFGKVDIEKVHKNLFIHLLSSTYGYEGARKKYEWSIEGPMLTVYTRTKPRKIKK